MSRRGSGDEDVSRYLLFAVKRRPDFRLPPRVSFVRALIRLSFWKRTRKSWTWDSDPENWTLSQRSRPANPVLDSESAGGDEMGWDDLIETYIGRACKEAYA